jgi:hypothetical protein
LVVTSGHPLSYSDYIIFLNDFFDERFAIINFVIKALDTVLEALHDSLVHDIAANMRLSNSLLGRLDISFNCWRLSTTYVIVDTELRAGISHALVLPLQGVESFHNAHLARTW